MKKKFFFIAIFILVYCITSVYNMADWDLWARMAVGAIFFQTGTVLKHDIFAYTPLKDLWVDHEWGSGVVFYAVTHFLGDYGLCLLKFIIIFSIFLLVYRTNQNRQDVSLEPNPYRIGFYVLFLLNLLTAFDNSLRSHAFTYFFFALWLYMLDGIRKGHNKLIWVFPATMLVWANMHGGFLAGLGIATVFTLGEIIDRRPWKKYIPLLLSSFAVTFINPYGAKYWSYLIDAVSMPRPFVNEWNPMNLLSPFPQYMWFKITVILAALCIPYIIYAFVKEKRRFNWSDLLIIGVTFYMGMSHIRHIVFFGISTAAYGYYLLYPALNLYTAPLSSLVQKIIPGKVRSLANNLREGSIYACIIIIGILVMMFNPFSVDAKKDIYPVKAVKFIQENKISGNLLVLFNWGSYALWKLYPQCKVAIDGRYEEVYPTELINDVARFHYVGTNWDGLMKKYPPDAMLIPVDYDVYNKQLIYLKDWQIIHKDNIAAVLVPKSRLKKHYKPVPKNFNYNAEKYINTIKLDEATLKKALK